MLYAKTGARWPIIPATRISISSTAATGRTRWTRWPSSPSRSARRGRSTCRARAAQGPGGRARRRARARASSPTVAGRRSSAPDDGHTVMNLCMAATYDPDPKAPNGFRLPFNLETGERIEARWKRWLAHDPIHMVRRHAKALRSLRGIYIDCGWPTSTTSTTARASSRSARRARHRAHATRSSTTTTPTSTTAWTEPAVPGARAGPGQRAFRDA